MSDEKVEGEGVRKLDDPEQFNAIKTNLKTPSGLKEHECQIRDLVQSTSREQSIDFASNQGLVKMDSR